MRKNGIAILIAVILAAWGIYDFVHDKGKADEITFPDEIETGIQKGNRAPDFALRNLEGDLLKLSDFTGKKVILNFWATWCPPCRAEMPHMEKVYNDYADEVVVLAVNLTHTEKNEAAISDFADNYGLTFPIVLDANGETSQTYRIRAYPTSYIVDSLGIIQEIYPGAISYEIMTKAITRIR